MQSIEYWQTNVKIRNSKKWYSFKLYGFDFKGHFSLRKNNIKLKILRKKN